MGPSGSAGGLSWAIGSQRGRRLPSAARRLADPLSQKAHHGPSSCGVGGRRVHRASCTSCASAPPLRVSVARVRRTPMNPDSPGSRQPRRPLGGPGQPRQFPDGPQHLLTAPNCPRRTHAPHPLHKPQAGPVGASRDAPMGATQPLAHGLHQVGVCTTRNSPKVPRRERRA